MGFYNDMLEMRGGSLSDAVCPCCGLPFISDIFSVYNDDFDNTFPEIQNPNIDAWLNLGHAFFSDGSRVQFNQYSGNGLVHEVGTEEMLYINWPENDSGIGIHQDCATVIEAHIGRPLSFHDLVEISRDGKAYARNFFNGVIFNWSGIFIEKGEDYFASPLINATLKDAIIAGLPELTGVNEISNNLESVNINASNNNSPVFNALYSGEIEEGNILGFFPNNTGKIYPGQAIIVRKASNAAGEQSNMWKGILASKKNPFTRAPIGTRTYRKAHMKAKTRRGGRRRTTRRHKLIRARSHKRYARR